MEIAEIIVPLSSAAIRFAIAGIMLWTHGRNKSRLSFNLAIFFIFFGMHAMFRVFAEATGESAWYFLHRLFVMLGCTMVMRALESVGVEWIRNAKLVPILLVLSVLLAYSDTYIYGALGGEALKPLAFLPTLSIFGIVLLIAAYYFAKLGKLLPPLGKNLMVFGLAGLGLLHPASVVMYSMTKSTALIFAIGILCTLCIGIGWWISLRRRGRN